MFNDVRKRSRLLSGRVKGLRYAVGLNDFRLAQRLRMGLVAVVPLLEEKPMRDEITRLVDVSGLWVRNVGDRHKTRREIEKLVRDIIPQLGGGRAKNRALRASSRAEFPKRRRLGEGTSPPSSVHQH